MSYTPQVILYATPLFIALVLIEIVAYLRRGGSAYTWRESFASIGVGLGYKIIQLLKLGVPAGVTLFLWEHRVAEVPLSTWWGILLLFLGVEFAYYWFHRLSHEVRWMWATHAVHHSPEHLNVLAAYRLGWTGLISGGWLCFMPLIVLGFHPAAVFLTLALNLLYQSWIHTDLIPKLGPLEYVLNTPSNHRVHHAMNADYLDRNYGGVTVIFDRLFGTYVEERETEPCQYGLVTPVGSQNPIVIAFHEWARMIRDVRGAKSLREAAGYMFGPPGWKPNGQGVTSDDLRRAWRAEHGLRDETAQTEPGAGRRLARRSIAAVLALAALIGIATISYARAETPALRDPSLMPVHRAFVPGDSQERTKNVTDQSCAKTVITC